MWKKAPFKNKANKPYLETHHIIWLSEGGRGDTIDNTVALCPNCHKKMHVLGREDELKNLKLLIKEYLNKSMLCTQKIAQ
ncbi:HNH endonuclease [endosymbiont 'TC1' of Trimyema compressum]|uniref:HNH endonuclease n=1 Tax=endosymbiont 'TC1' of Trimyema compressum TaxID=243899 RepID=UPI001FE198FD|nr:HNH endonuclease [endosymbiont 'TC1' of Trimyema compressum]